MPPLTLSIRSYPFHIAPRFEAGTILTLGEAHAMNQLLSETVRNNVARWVIEAIAGEPDGILPAETIAALQDRIAKYAGDYQFQIKGAKPSVGALELTIDEIVGEQMGKAGLSPEASPGEATVLRTSPTIIRLARERLLEREQFASKTLEELL